VHFQPAAAGGLVAGNYIGPDASGETGPGNGEGIIVQEAANVVIGGTEPPNRNVISGNGRGIHAIENAGLVLEGNYIGTDATGTAPLGNQTGFLLESRAADGAQIGGTVPGAGNLISANGIGLDLGGHQNVVEGNLIGTDITGTRPLGNGAGIRLGVIDGGGRTQIGGTEAGAGNLISGNGAGIGTGSDATFVVIEGNLIGTDITGTSALPNTDGVSISSSQDLVGGTMPGAGNVISGNRHFGLDIDYEFNTIQGNLIGTDVSGTQPLGNGSDGVHIDYYDCGCHTTIGGTAPGAGNVIANNGGNGISSAGSHTVIQGNLIGTDITGTVPMGNRGNGVKVVDYGQVGGIGAGNVIANNGGDGILAGGNNVTIQGNLIGTDITGTVPMGNRGNGVHLADVGFGFTILGMVGGTDPGAGNVIAYSGRDGVLIDQQAQTGAILANSIHDSGRLGIELAAGANNNQAFPDLTSATLTNGSTVITGTLASTPDTAFTLEFFANDVCNPSGYGEGQYLLGDATVTTDDNGQADFTVTVGSSNPGQFIAATATDPINDTSAFSACVQVTGPAAVIGGLSLQRTDAAPSVEAAPARRDGSPVLGAAASSSAAAPARTTRTGTTAPAHLGAAAVPRQADADRFWQEFGLGLDREL
jgi:hypothetical protein